MDMETLLQISVLFNILLGTLLAATVYHLYEAVTVNQTLDKENDSLLQALTKERNKNGY
jgi:hypothetical protein